MKAANKANMGREGIAVPTVDECARYAQVEELHRIADALEKLVKQGEPIKVSL
jgi:protein-tyrosine phosphatase